jgi:hypothetical protein
MEKKADDNFDIENILNKILNIESNLLEKATKILLNHGWYLSGHIEMKQTSLIVELIRNECFVEAEIKLLGFYRENLNTIKTQLINKNPNRKSVLEEAFKAHNNKMYFSSTILFISQADGIIDGKIFHNRKNLDKFLNNRSVKIVELLKEDSSLNIPSIKLKKTKYISKMNRHSIMHGESTDYNTEINSLKALSLCCFVNDWYNRYDK